MAQISSPARRVLGERDKNASLNITSPQKDVKASTNTRSQQSPVKVFPGTAGLLSPTSRAGQKRRIHEVAGVEAQNRSRTTKSARPAELVSDSGSEDGVNTSMLSTVASKSMADTSMTSFSASQEGPDSLEQHFELPHEEMSQRTLEKIHAVPMPQYTSQPIPLVMAPALFSGTSQDSVGMSNFIDFGGSDASQRSDGLEMIEAKSTKERERKIETIPEEIESVQSGLELTEEERRKSMLGEKAAQLRIRLQLAMFKVQTNQTMRPLSRLKVPESMKRTPSPPQTLLSSSLTAASAMAALEDMEARVSAFRAQATAQGKPGVRSLNSMPIPSIQPTLFSARYTNEMTTHSHPATVGRTEAIVQIPSSPPISRHSADTELDGDQTSHHSSMSSQRLPSSKAPTVIRGSQEQLSSPPVSQSGRDDIDSQNSKNGQGTQISRTPTPTEIAKKLTNSVVTGEAASGLLQLMRGS